MQENENIEAEAKKFFISHYPNASQSELEKQFADWKNKIETGEGLVKFFSQRIGPVKDKKILDVGFGSGLISISFAKAGAIMSGVDVEPDLLGVAGRNAGAYNLDINFKIYNGRTLPFSDNYFDFVICSSVLEHTSFPEETIKEIFRVLRPGGRIFLSVPNKYYPKETHTLAYFVSYLPRRLANLYLKILKRSPLEHDNLHFYSYFDIIKMLNQSKHSYSLLYKDLNQMSGLKKLIILTLKKLNIHYTIFLKQLIFIIEKNDK